MSTVLLSQPSGLADVDRQWGGLGAGHTYLLVGRAGAGRSSLALRAAQATVDGGGTCLLLSPRPPSELVEIGSEIGFDLAAAHGAGLLRPLRIPTAAELAERGADGLETAYRDLVALARSEGATRVVVEDFTPLVQFDSFERLEEAFAGLVADVRDLEATLVVGLGAPANDASRRLLDIVRGAAEGVIQVHDDGGLTLDPAPPADPFADDPFADDAEDAAPPSLLSEVAFAPPATDGADDETTGSAETDAIEAEIDHYDTDGTEDEAASGPDAQGGAAEVDVDDSVPEGGVAEGPAEQTGGAEPDADDADPEPASGDAAPASELLPEDEGDGEAPTVGASDAEAASPEATVVAPPPVDPGLLHPNGEDPFGSDPADAIMEQGYLADSHAAVAGPSSDAGFTPLVDVSEGPEAAFRRALATAFQTRSAGVPFLVVAVRMQPGSPEAARFPNVATALRNALPDGAHMISNDARKRAIVLLPVAGAEAGQALFAALQKDLRRTIGGDADGALQAISAVTVPDAQPFAAPADLMAYAYDG